MHVIYSSTHLLHNTSDIEIEGQPFVTEEMPERAEILLKAVQAARLGPVIAPGDHGLAPILAVHDTGYVEFLRTAYDRNTQATGRPGPLVPWTFATRHTGRRPNSLRGLLGYYAFGWGSPILEGTWTAAYWSAQCALTAADRVLAGGHAAYALCRPPGHHAGRDLYGGFCYLNNAAIAARYVQAQFPHDLPGFGESGSQPDRSAPPRVAILDIDYHHGNGTQSIFYADPTVLYCSLHAHPDDDYPYYWGEAGERGEGPGEGLNRNWPLPQGIDDAGYLAVLDEALAAVHEFGPAALIVSAGQDVGLGDPSGGFAITPAGLQAIGRRIAALGLPAVIVQEGGYRLETLGENLLAFLSAWG
jgi:acetoin utilization deacetylase AcuC-like enzyme